MECHSRPGNQGPPSEDHWWTHPGTSGDLEIMSGDQNWDVEENIEPGSSTLAPHFSDGHVGTLVGI